MLNSFVYTAYNASNFIKVAETSSTPHTQEKTTVSPAIAVQSTSSLTPAHHTDQFGNEVDNVTGGRVFSDAYYIARKEAEDHAVQRGKLFEESQVAFKDGKKKEAKELSDQAKDHGNEMEAANKRAVNEILKPQNLANSDKIDLHGLFVQEAVDATKDFAKSHVGKKQELEIITGAGHHSDKAKGPVIKPAIIELCKQEGWRLEKHEKNEGSFTLYLSAGTNQM
eukprot:gene11211-15042_t